MDELSDFEHRNRIVEGKRNGDIATGHPESLGNLGVLQELWRQIKKKLLKELSDFEHKVIQWKYYHREKKRRYL